MAESLSQTLADIQSSLDDLAAGLIAVPRGPGSIKGGMIAPNTVTATNINVQKLAAVSTDTGSLSVTGSLVMTTSGVFSAGQTAYNTGIGWWLEYNGGTPRLSLGDSANAHLTWDGSALSIVGANLILDSGGTFGDVFLIQNSGNDAGALYATALELVLVQGTPSVQGAQIQLTSTDFLISDNAGNTLRSSGGNIITPGHLFPGGQATRYVGDDGTNIVLHGPVSTFSSVSLGGQLQMGSSYSGTTGSGTLPSPTKWFLIQTSGGTYYYVPAYSASAPWTA